MANERILESLEVAEGEIEQFQLAQLKAFLPVVASRHPYYRSLLHDLKPRAWSDLTDIDAIPITSKSHLATDPNSFRLRNEHGAFHESWDLVYTSGTTGKPVPIYQTTDDYRRILYAQRRMAEIRGIRSSDRIANLFPLASRPNGSWLRVNDQALTIGAMLVAGLGGPNTGQYSPTRRLAEVTRVVAEAEPTILWGVGSYIRRFLAACKDADHSLTHVRMVVASGEALDPAISLAIRTSLKALGAPKVEISPGFGASELQCSLVPCAEGSGLHNPAPELFLLQTVDDRDRTLPAGSQGRLILTHLDRSGTVLLRYALGDIVTLERDRCPNCGRAGERMVAHHGRGDRMVKIRGQLVDLQTVGAVVAAEPDVTEHAVEVVPQDPAAPDAMDVLRVKIATSPHTKPADVANRVGEAVHSAVSVRPTVLTVHPEDIFPIEDAMKPTRLGSTP